EGGFRPANRPFDTRVHAGGERAVAVVNIQFDWHSARLWIEGAGNARDGSGVGALRIRRNLELDTGATDDAGDILLRDRYDHAQVRKLLNDQQDSVVSRADERAGMDETVGNHAIERRHDA